MKALAAAVVSLIVSILVGCASTAEAPHATQTVRTTVPTSSVATVSPGVTTTPSPVTSVVIPRPDDLQSAVVTDVVDGDTVEVEIGGERYKLRYIGVDTPETVDPNRPVGCFGHEASDRNTDLVQGKTVGLEKDVSDTDDFGRLLRYVWVDGQMVNALLVRDGYAEAETGFAEVKYQTIFLQLQAEAKAAGRGIWGPECANATPVVSATQTAPAGSGSEVCEFSGTNQAVIKGNVSSSGEKIYHVPGQDSYDETGITESRGERWFCTEAEAVAAGWRKSKS